MSVPSPITTPWDTRPSIIEAPSVPALKLTNPSCMTVVPGERYARDGPARRPRYGHRPRDVVEEARELVEPLHLDAVAQQRGTQARRVVGVDGAGVGPRDVGQVEKIPSSEISFRTDEPVRQCVERR